MRIVDLTTHYSPTALLIHGFFYKSSSSLVSVHFLDDSMEKVAANLGTIQETLLITLWARAVELQAQDPIIRDQKSAEILTKIDYDFSKLNGGKSSQTGICLRGLEFDQWVKSFLKNHPTGTIVEIGSGLNTRFERVDNGQLQWFDLDLPDAIALRNLFFEESNRRQFISSSILDSGWINRVRLARNIPTMFVAEGVLMYFDKEQVKQVFALLYEHFPGCLVAFDSMSPFMAKNQKRHDVMKNYDAKFKWAIKNAQEIQSWNSEYKVLETKTFQDFSPKYLRRMGWFNNLLFKLPLFRNSYRLSLVKLGN